MLKACISISRKLRRTDDSAVYRVQLHGEIPYPPDDTDAVLEKVSELFHLAEEALAIEIDREIGRMKQTIAS